MNSGLITDDYFDISMGTLDSAESFDLVCLFIFYNLTLYDDVNADNTGL